MSNITNGLANKNLESPFTELFALVIRHEILPEGLATLAYESEQLKLIQRHIDNAVDVLLHGLQDLGYLIGVASQNKKKVMSDLNNIGFFITVIANLTEALNSLRLDTGYVLQQRGITDL